MPDPGFPARLKTLQLVFDTYSRDEKLAIARQLNHICLMGSAAAPVLRALTKAIDEYWNDDDPETLWHLTSALASIRSTDPIAVAVLNKALEHEDLSVRHAAIQGLGDIGAAAHSALIGLREHTDAEDYPDFIVESARKAIDAIEGSANN